MFFEELAFGQKAQGLPHEQSAAADTVAKMSQFVLVCPFSTIKIRHVMKATIGLISGSLRKESFSKKLALAIQKMAPEEFEFQMVSIEGLPVFNQDFDQGGEVPASYDAFRKKIQSLDGVIFVTPEHNRSVPAALKNALDVGSWPYGENAWAGKPGAVFSCSPGDISGFGAHHHLRQCLAYLDVAVMAQPEVYLAGADKLFDDQGAIKDSDKEEFVKEAVDAYCDWYRGLKLGAEATFQHMPG